MRTKLLGLTVRCERWGRAALLALGPAALVCDAEPDADGRRTFGIRLIVGR